MLNPGTAMLKHLFFVSSLNRNKIQSKINILKCVIRGNNIILFWVIGICST